MKCRSEDQNGIGRYNWAGRIWIRLQVQSDLVTLSAWSALQGYCEAKTKDALHSLQQRRDNDFILLFFKLSRLRPCFLLYNVNLPASGQAEGPRLSNGL